YPGTKSNNPEKPWSGCSGSSAPAGWASRRRTRRCSTPPSRSTSPPSPSSRCSSTGGPACRWRSWASCSASSSTTTRSGWSTSSPCRRAGQGSASRPSTTSSRPICSTCSSRPAGPEMVVGWYHSHPGFGCWLSGVDINTQQSFEALNPRAVAVVIDPIQSVKGKVVIDAFRLINPQTMMLGQEPRQTTSNVGHLNKPSIQALIHGLNRHYYSIAINYRKNELEEKMLLNLHKKKWTDGLILKKFDAHSETNEQTVQEMLSLAIKYNKAVQEEDELSPEKLAIANVGRQDAKKHLEEHVSNLMSSNIVQTLAIFMGVL
uniref:JAB1/MPN/MOV34 metalloenzyme domain-containing protein n=1 Tax=Aegilops tauschii subsp. strangulata TaxID=200361 RepID=A0A453EPH2_AEGTS